MRLKKGSIRKENGNSIENLPFRRFEVEISRLESAAKNGNDPEARRKAADTLIRDTQTLGTKVGGALAVTDIQDKYNTARFALGRVVSARDPAIRKLAFEAIDWDAIALKLFCKCPYPEIRRMAGEMLRSGKSINSGLLKDPEELKPPGAKHYQLGTWRS
jgi:hypothetical protein